MNKIKTVKIKEEDGSISEESYTIAADAVNIDMKNGKDLQETVGNIDVDNDGNIASQLKNKINKNNIVDNLNSMDPNKVLSANQGKILGDDIDTLKISNNKKPYYYNTIADMKADNKLKAGDMAITLGYYEVNDGGGAEYLIRTKMQNDVEDNRSIHFIGNNLVAEKIMPYSDNKITSFENLTTNYDLFSQTFNKRFFKKFTRRLNQNLEMITSKMDLNFDWINANNEGNPYQLAKKEDFEYIIDEEDETLSITNNSANKTDNAIIHFNGGCLYPTTNIRIKIKSMTKVNYGCKVGVSLQYHSGQGSLYQNYKRVDIFVQKKNNNYCDLCYEYFDNNVSQGIITIKEDVKYQENMNLIIKPFEKFYFCYVQYKKTPVFIDYFSLNDLNQNEDYNTFMNTEACVYMRLGAGENIVLSGAETYLDCGNTQSDMKPIKYEDGTPLISDGKIYMVMNCREVNGNAKCSVFEYNISTCEFKLVGRLLFNYMDGKWRSTGPATIIYNRKNNKWIIYMVNFNTGHFIGYNEVEADVRYGINCIEIKFPNNGSLVNELDEVSCRYGDEDPDIIYDEKTKKWYLIIDRVKNDSQLIDYNGNKEQTNLSSFSFTNDILTVSCNNKTYPFVRYDVLPYIKRNAGKVVNFGFSDIQITGERNGDIVALIIKHKDGSSDTYKTLVNDQKQIRSYTCPIDYNNISRILVQIMPNNSSTPATCTVQITEPQFYVGTTKPEYETFDDDYYYYVFQSNDPFGDWEYYGKVDIKDATGGSLVKIGGRIFIICGCSFDDTSLYKFCALDNLNQIGNLQQYLYNDGGFRGWGTLIPITVGNTTKYLWFTFDRWYIETSQGILNRHNYGNIYLYESITMNEGHDGNLTYNF